jgi:hypothetical protein
VIASIEAREEDWNQPEETAQPTESSAKRPASSKVERVNFDSFPAFQTFFYAGNIRDRQRARSFGVAWQADPARRRGRLHSGDTLESICFNVQRLLQSEDRAVVLDEMGPGSMRPARTTLSNARTMREKEMADLNGRSRAKKAATGGLSH